jgi:hypothetical protein
MALAEDRHGEVNSMAEKQIRFDDGAAYEQMRLGLFAVDPLDFLKGQLMAKAISIPAAIALLIFFHGTSHAGPALGQNGLSSLEAEVGELFDYFVCACD